MDQYKITTELFILPYKEKFILYCPLKRLGFLVNSAVINLLSHINRGTLTRKLSVFEEKTVEIFRELGIINGVSECLGEENIDIINAPFLPTEATLFLTTQCNLRCIYCYAVGGEKSNVTMTWEVAKATIDHIVNNALTKQEDFVGLGFHGGGEPTLAWDLLKRCVSYIYERGAKEKLNVNISMATNGIISEKRLDWIIENLKGVNISFDGTEEIQNYQRPMVDGTPTFDLVFSTIKRMDEKEFPYSIRSTVTGKSVSRMAEFVEFLGTKTKAKNIHFEPLFVCGRCLFTNVDPPGPKEFIQGFREALHIGKKFNINILYSGARLYAITPKFCQAAGDSFCVTPEGYVTSCYEVCSIDDPRSKTFFYGKYDTLSKQFIIDPEKLSNLRARVVKNIKFCSNCFCKYHCAGDCLTRSTDGFNLINLQNTSRCEINRELTKDQILEVLCRDEGIL